MITNTYNSKPNIPFLKVVSGMVFSVSVLFSAVTINAVAENSPAPAPLSYKADWRWVKGAVFVPTSAVNEAQQWDEYDPVRRIVSVSANSAGRGSGDGV